MERVDIRSSFSVSSKTDQLMTIGCGDGFFSPRILSFPLPAFLKKGGMVRAVSPWYLVAWKSSLTARSIFQAYDLCFVCLSKLSCLLSSCCMLATSALEPESSRVCLRRCHCTPSRLKCPEGNWIVAIPCVVTALMRPVVVSQISGFSKIWTAPTSGGIPDYFKDVLVLGSYLLRFRGL